MNYHINYSTTNFLGYGATPLQAVLTRDCSLSSKDKKCFYNMCNELKEILSAEGVDVFVQTPGKISNNLGELFKEDTFLNKRYFHWVQDIITFLRNRIVIASSLGSDYSANVAEYFSGKFIKKKEHIAGGNFFIMPEEQSLLIGMNDYKKYPEKYLKQLFGVKKILPISQPDFHIDLGIRPLNKKNILINSPDLTVTSIKNALLKIERLLNSDTTLKEELNNIRQYLIEFLNQFTKIMKSRHNFNNFNQICEQLESYGYNVIKTPASLLLQTDDANTDSYVLNYMNAIVHAREDGSLVYITNKSTLDDILGITPEIEKMINFSFEKIFINSIKDYVAPKDIHFIDKNYYLSELLDKSQGGLHCKFTEIPK